MRNINYKSIEENIKKNKKKVNLGIAKLKGENPKVNSTKKRDPDESEALTKVAKVSLEKAKREGKFVIKGDRRIYYGSTR